MGVTIISNVHAMPLFIERHVTRFQPINVSKLYIKNDNLNYRKHSCTCFKATWIKLLRQVVQFIVC